MKLPCVMILSLAAAALTGCAVPYTPPPASATTATLDITVHNLFGWATLNIDSGILQHQNLVTAHTLGKEVTTSTIVSTDKPVRLIYHELVGASECDLQFMFQPAPGLTYDLFVGDVAPAAATTELGKFGQWLFPMAGKGCFAKAWKKQADGSMMEVQLNDAMY